MDRRQILHIACEAASVKTDVLNIIGGYRLLANYHFTASHATTPAKFAHISVHHDFDVVTSISFSNVFRTPSAGEQRSQSSAKFI